MNTLVTGPLRVGPKTARATKRKKLTKFDWCLRLRIRHLTIEPLFDPTLRNLTVTVSAHFAVDAQYFRMAVVLTEDSVHQPGVNGYGQTNAYSSTTRVYVPRALPLCINAHGPVVSSEFMHHRHVARAIIPNYEGDLESLPQGKGWPVRLHLPAHH